MAEAVQDSTELRTLVSGSAHKAVVKDKSGVEHQLSPLDLSDLCEYEDKVGASLFAMNLTALKLREIAILLYLSLRKEGCSSADIEARKFRWTERQVYMMFDLNFMTQSAEVFVDLLKLSGLEVKEPRPQKPSPDAAV